MTIDIDHLTEQELIDLNRRVVERFRLLAQGRTHDAMLRFRRGQRVSFDLDDGRVISGILVRHNKKTVTVVADDQQRWNVSPGCLREAAAPATTGAA